MEKELIVITGSSGFIGSKLIESISDKYHIIGLDRSPGSGLGGNVGHITMDITSDEEVAEAFRKIRERFGKHISSVVHLAAYYDFSGKPSPLYDKITVEGTERLINNLQDFEVGQFVFSSSMLVYKPSSPGVKIDEAWPLEPKWDYPKSKVKTEKLLMKERGNIPLVNLRVAGVYTDEGDSIPISNQIQRIYEKQLTAYLFPGDPSHGNAFIHLEDLIAAIENCIVKRKGLPKVLALNISEEETLSYKEMQDIISREIHGKEMPLIRIPKFIGKIGAFFQNLTGETFIKPWMIDIADDHFEMDCSKAKELIDWKPKHNLRKTLPVIVSNLKKNPKAWYKKNKLKYPGNSETEK